MEDYVLAAIIKGLSGTDFLEHMEEGINAPARTWLTESDFDYYFGEGERLKKKYGEQLNIGLGVECGYNPACKDMLISRLKNRNWDEVGISCHFLKLEQREYHLNLFSRKKQNLQLAQRLGVTTLFDTYLTTLLEAVSFLPGTILCHLDGPLRSLPQPVLTDDQLQKIESILQIVMRKGMALEINSSGIRIRGEQFPSCQIMKRASSIGVPLVAGSDAHKPDDVGNGFNDLEQLL